jgi:hypothetical protein
MKRLLLIIIFFNIVSISYSQKKQNLPLSADSLATGNYKDVLGSFFQLAFNKFTSPDKELKFTSNPFAVMAKLDTNLLRSSEYYKYRHLRDLNFSFSAKLDSSYKFNGFTSGIKYALINRRDETVSRVFVQDILDDSRVRVITSLNTALDQYINTFSNDDSLQKKLQEEKVKFTRGKITFDKLDNKLQTEIIKIAKDSNFIYLEETIIANPKFNIKETAAEIYTEIKEKINNKLLWTVGFTDTTYKDKFMFSNITLSSELLKGIDDMKSKDVELNLKVAVQFLDDTLKSGRDLKRSILSFEPGLNFVLKTKNTLKSFFEFKLSGSYYHNFNTLYKNEKRDSLTINGTLRLRIYNDIWIPLEIKYDPDNGNIFGFLNVRANFTGLGKILKGASK